MSKRLVTGVLGPTCRSRFGEATRKRFLPGEPSNPLVEGSSLTSRAFLQVDRYYHGARSMEALLDMSSVGGLLAFEPSSQPPDRQLALHVDATKFLELVASAR